MARRLRVEFNKGSCIGNGSCAAISPDHFELRSKKATLLDSNPYKELSVKEIECNDTDAKSVIDAGIACPVNAIRVFDLASEKDIVSFKVEEKSAKEVIASYDDKKDFIIDGKNYFLIRVDVKNKNIEVGFCKEKNKIALKVVGKKPVEIYQTLMNKEKLPIRNDHAAYLGRELQKAYISLKCNIEYIQDEELDFDKKFNH
jgi:ferredoxin